MRRSQLIHTPTIKSKSLDDNSLTSIELITVIISAHGWIRAAKGHELDPTTLSYKAGDDFLNAARGKSNQMAIFLDTTGRSYAVPANSLPSARGYGEPLSSRITPPDGAKFITVIMGDPNDELILGTNNGYGFITTIEELTTRNRAGKLVINVANDAQVLKPLPLLDVNSRIAIVTNSGYLLIFAVSELPRISKGKGVKLITIHDNNSNNDKQQLEYIITWTLIGANQKLILNSGKQRPLILSAQELENFVSGRARRGSKLPRSYQRIDSIIVES